MKVGRYHSSGTFTIHPEKALERLDSFRLAQADLVALKLVQAAVALGAQQVRFGANSFGFTVEWDGKGVSPRDLPDLLLWLVDPARRDSGLTHLALGVASATAVPGRQVWLESHGLRRSFRQGQDQVVECRPKPTHRFGVRYGPEEAFRALLGTDVRSWFGSGPGCSLGRLVWERCALAPIPVWVNGLKVNRWVVGHHRTDHRDHHLKEWYVGEGRIPAPVPLTLRDRPVCHQND